MPVKAEYLPATVEANKPLVIDSDNFFCYLLQYPDFWQNGVIFSPKLHLEVFCEEIHLLHDLQNTVSLFTEEERRVIMQKILADPAMSVLREIKSDEAVYEMVRNQLKVQVEGERG